MTTPDTQPGFLESLARKFSFKKRPAETPEQAVVAPRNERERKQTRDRMMEVAGDSEKQESIPMKIEAASSAFAKNNPSQDSMYPPAEISGSPFRDTNEKAEKNGLFLVADGLGGMERGDFASSETMRAVSDRLADVPQDASVAEVKQLMLEAVEEANHNIGFDEKTRGKCATTLTVSKIVGDRMVIGQIGDSRLYRFRNNKLEMITPEDSFIYYFNKYKLVDNPENTDELVQLSKVKDKILELEKTGASLSEINILKNAYTGYVAGGFDSVTVGDLRAKMFGGINGSGDMKKMMHILETDVADGDMYLMGSDGLSDNLPDDILEYYAKWANGDSKKLAEALTDMTNAVMNLSPKRKIKAEIKNPKLIDDCLKKNPKFIERAKSLAKFDDFSLHVWKIQTPEVDVDTLLEQSEEPEEIDVDELLVEEPTTQISTPKTSVRPPPPRLRAVPPPPPRSARTLPPPPPSR